MSIQIPQFPQQQSGSNPFEAGYSTGLMKSSPSEPGDVTNKIAAAQEVIKQRAVQIAQQQQAISQAKQKQQKDQEDWELEKKARNATLELQARRNNLPSSQVELQDAIMKHMDQQKKKEFDVNDFHIDQAHQQTNEQAKQVAQAAQFLTVAQKIHAQALKQGYEDPNAQMSMLGQQPQQSQWQPPQNDQSFQRSPQPVAADNSQQFDPSNYEQYNANYIKQMGSSGIGQRLNYQEWLNGKDVLEKDEIAQKRAELEMAAQVKTPEREAAQREKEEQKSDTIYANIIKGADPATASSRSVLGVAANANRRADTALATLVNPYKGIITNQEAGNIMADVASIYQSGTPTEFGMSTQEYQSLIQSFAKTGQYFSAHPQDALPREFKDRLIDVLGRLKKVNSNIIMEHLNRIELGQKKVISKHQDEWNDFKNSMLQSSFVADNQTSLPSQTQSKQLIKSKTKSGIPFSYQRM